MKGYSFQKYDGTRMARAKGIYLPISTKKAVEICRYIKGLNLNKAMRILKEVIELKRPIPYKRYNLEMAHRKGMGTGGYPQKPAKYILKILEDVLANAKAKGLDENKLKIIHIAAHRAVSKEKVARGFRKGTHIEVVVEESD